MSKPLTHRPFEALEPPAPEVTVIRRRTTDPESGLKLVRQIRATPLPTDPPPNARLTPDPTESESEPVAARKKRKGRKHSPESIAKLKATIAAKRARGEAVGAQSWQGKKKRGKASEPRTGEKKAFVLANPTVGVTELVKLAKKQGLKLHPNYVYTVRSSERKNGAAKKQPQSHGPSTNGASIGDLLEVIADAAIEIKRRLSQLTL